MPTLGVARKAFLKKEKANRLWFLRDTPEERERGREERRVGVQEGPKVGVYVCDYERGRS
jgi:hypothetical protein